MTPSFLIIDCDLDKVEMYVLHSCRVDRSWMTEDPSFDGKLDLRSFAIVSIRVSNCPRKVVNPISSSTVATAGPSFLTVVAKCLRTVIE